MNFQFEEEHGLFRKMVRDFAINELAPGAAERDKNSEFPAEAIAQLGELGLMGAFIPEEYGGSGADAISYLIAVEELAREDPSVAVTMSVNNSVCCAPIYNFGTEEQKQRFIPDWINAKSIGFFAITEPNSGSDVVSMGTSATDRGDHWELNGQKMWISNAHVGNWGLVYAFTEKSKKYKGVKKWK